MSKRRRPAKRAKPRRGATRGAKRARSRASKPARERTTRRAKKAAPRAGEMRRAMATATSASKPSRERVAAIADTPAAITEAANLRRMLAVLRDRSEPIEVRLAALQALQAASFAVVAFAAHRDKYIAALREIATDPDAELRQRALGILTREHDGFAESKLIEGLQQPARALVPPEKALQLLSADPHAAAYPVARAIVANPPSDLAKREALRLLAADPNAAPLFEDVLRDKTQPADARQVSAAALNAIDPAKYQSHARAIVLDTAESDEMQASSLTALTEFGDRDALAADDALQQRAVDLTASRAQYAPVAARRFMAKYQR
ncbi:MAG TPA: hypothetical protein VFO19_11710 [Vicinamibacterales bacterium]|nr:hypothetical protein [Vicinamibacterales bacterium]